LGKLTSPTKKEVAGGLFFKISPDLGQLMILHPSLQRKKGFLTGQFFFFKILSDLDQLITMNWPLDQA
jgi:hypothetical protein